MGINNRKLVWSDDFTEPKLNREKWCFIHGMHSPDLEYNNGEEHVFIKEDKLVLLSNESKLEDKTYCVPESLSTKNTMCFKYGYLEMRAKIPYRHGTWPSFWMSSKKELKKADWFCEIDIFEVFSSTNAFVVNLHKWKDGEHAMLPGGEGCLNRGYIFKNHENLNNEYHTYGLEWNKEYMAFSVDGEEFAKFPIDGSYDFSEGLPGMDGFHDFCYILINNELFSPGRSWKPEGAELTSDDPMPVEYYIDYIRLYQNPEDGEEFVTEF